MKIYHSPVPQKTVLVAQRAARRTGTTLKLLDLGPERENRYALRLFDLFADGTERQRQRDFLRLSYAEAESLRDALTVLLEGAVQDVAQPR